MFWQEHNFSFRNSIRSRLAIKQLYACLKIVCHPQTEFLAAPLVMERGLLLAAEGRNWDDGWRPKVDRVIWAMGRGRVNSCAAGRRCRRRRKVNVIDISLSAGDRGLAVSPKFELEDTGWTPVATAAQSTRSSYHCCCCRCCYFFV